MFSAMFAMILKRKKLHKSFSWFECRFIDFFSLENLTFPKLCGTACRVTLKWKQNLVKQVEHLNCWQFIVYGGSNLCVRRSEVYVAFKLELMRFSTSNLLKLFQSFWRANDKVSKRIHDLFLNLMIQIFFEAFANLHNEIISEIEQFHPESTIFYPFWKTFSLNKTLLIVSQSFPLCDIDHDTHIGFADCWLFILFLSWTWVILIHFHRRSAPTFHSFFRYFALCVYGAARFVFLSRYFFANDT